MTDERRRLEYWRGEEILRNAAGETFKLQGNGKQLFSFSLESRRALDIELRVQPLATSVPDADIPLWRYSLELGHGHAMTKSVPDAPGVITQNPYLPHRGLLTHLSARELRVNVWLDSVFGGTTDGATSEVQISAQPTFGAIGWPSITYQDIATNADLRHRFPIESREFRMRDWVNGRPIPIGTIALDLWGLNGVPVVAAADAALYLDWTPIPLTAAFWSTDQPAGIQYR